MSMTIRAGVWARLDKAVTPIGMHDGHCLGSGCAECSAASHVAETWYISHHLRFHMVQCFRLTSAILVKISCPKPRGAQFFINVDSGPATSELLQSTRASVTQAFLIRLVMTGLADIH